MSAWLTSEVRGMRLALGLLIASWPGLAAGPQGQAPAPAQAQAQARSLAVALAPAQAAPAQTRPAGSSLRLASEAATAEPGQQAAGSSAAPALDGAAPVRVLLAPAQETTLASQIAARVQAVPATLGSHVAKGATLVSFDCEEQAARLKMSQAELSSTRESHEAKLRLQGLQQAGEVEVALAASQAARAEAQVELYRAQIAQCKVTAPFSGRVVKVAVKAFQGVSAGQALVELVSDGPLKLRLNAPGKWAGWLRRGTRFEVQIDETGRRYEALVTALNGRIDPISQTLEIEAAVASNSTGLLPGMSGNARFRTPL